ncbi:MAG: phenylalanine--tRNA ligase subunit alpha [Candidatus Uhrbacteria bacterium]|nr:phenylalanine--tRNA ligase subunit alpha [Candidatus Uhrbacteria bacterium]
MKKELEQLRDEFLSAVKDVADAAGLEDLRVEYLGRKGKLAGIMKQLPSLAEDLRKDMGSFANEVKAAIETAFTEAHDSLHEIDRESRREVEWLDITMPGTQPKTGHLHLVTQAIEEVNNIFARLGFVLVRHPEVEWDLYAFESLNMPKDHPARDEWETFFIADGEKQMVGENGKVVLTPHTSNGQVREMEKGNMPIRMININKCYRRQSDVSHAPMFHQFEGLMIDKNVTIAELKGTIDFFAKNFFGADREIRLRPFHFRFTEPSFEIDITCDVCKGTGGDESAVCRLCKDGWLELGGAGMVHPNVLKAGNLDPDEYTGFAFGWGVERTMMMKAGLNIADIRTLYRNDLRFLRQF